MGSAVSTKSLLPRVTGRIVEREHLLVQLLAARRLRCVVLTGPTGLGKSTLLSSWRQALTPLGYDPAWLSLSAEDNEPERFLAGLVDAFAQVDPQITAQARALDGGAGDIAGVEHLMITLVRAIARHRREVVLILDDVHHLAQPAISEALQWLLDYAPANLHVAMSSRTAPQLSLDRLRAQAQVLELGPQQLRFTLAETEQFLRVQVGDIDRRSAKILHELSDGWVAGLQLFAIEWRKKRTKPVLAARGDAFTRVPVRDAKAFARFFEQEVFEHLQPGEADLLVSLAPCRRFNAALAVAVADPEDGIAGAAGMLARLETENLFVTVADGDSRTQPWYRVHPLLRELLLERFAALDEARQQELHGRAWRWFRDQGHHDEAVRHAVSAGEAGQAADFVEQCAPALFLRGERAALVSLVRQLPARQVRAHLGLRVWMMRSHLYLRELDACAQALDDLERDVPAGDARTRYLLAVHRAALAVQRDDTDGALLLLPRLLDAPAGADVVSLGARNNILSWLYMHRNDYAAARQIQCDETVLMADGRPFLCTAAGSLYGRSLVGLSYALEGQMTQAERLYRSTLHEAEQLGKGCADTVYFAAALLGDVLYEINDTQAARQLLEDRIDVLERIAIPDAVLRALRVMSAAHWLEGHPQESFAWLERMENYANRHGLDRLLAHSLSLQVRQRLALGEHMTAMACMERLDLLSAQRTPSASGVQEEIDELARRTQIRWRVEQRDLDGAAALLVELMAQCEARGHLRSMACLHLESALIESRRGNEAAARQKALVALRMGHRLGLLRSLLDVGSGVLRLLHGVARDSELDPVLGFYIERLESTGQAHAAMPAQAPALSAPKGDLLGSFSDREIDMLRLLIQTMPNKRIARALGLSPETVKWYLSRIYGKLGVGGRDEAVARVRDLGWLAELQAREVPPP